MTTLLLSARHTEDNQALWRAAIRRKWQVIRAQGLKLPEMDDDETFLYIEGLFAPSIAAQLNRRLLSPADDWLPSLPRMFTRRSIRLTTLGTLRSATTPQFVKPPNEKLFAARVFDTGEDLPRDFEDDLPVLTAEPVHWTAEFRCFCLDQQVRTLSPYLRNGRHAKHTRYAANADEHHRATELATRVLTYPEADSPRAVVIDVGQLETGEWAVVEANSAWESGIYGCAPEAVLDVVRQATVRA